MRVIVCGAGQVGTTIARHLAREGNDVTVIDLDPLQARRADESYDVRGMVGHASHPEVLREAGAEDADLLVAVTRSDEVNMVACQLGHSLFGVKRRIARLRHHGYLEPIWQGLYAPDQMPIDVIISPEREVARGIARRLHAPGAFDMVPLAEGRVQLLGLEVEEGAPVAGQSVKALREAAARSGFVVVALLREGQASVPAGTDRLRPGDDVYMIAQPALMHQVMAAFGHRDVAARRLLIVGGGNVGVHLARRLAGESLVSLKLIEHDPQRAEAIARELGPKVVVLQGDALERDLLEEANVGAVDTLVAVTNDDETNIFVSVLAKRAGCRRAVTLVNKASYESVLDVMGIDVAVSPSAITISSILRHVRRGAVAQVHRLRGDFGEVLEAEALAGSPLVAAPLGKAGLPRGMLVGAVLRRGEAIIPDAATQVMAGDNIIAVVAHDALREAEAVLSVPGQEQPQPPSQGPIAADDP
ncbi:Trk system potassium transporter TrkA [Teichococcus oryzae]|uniref:Trk system potassium uptake protein TrkA n=1 Tax=Teichococcus oryzae TaxID=1608942 RepID=A0A5B2THH1_9PROT|nr:Trk system potassium transporter TrkA [Pseudoroseomonas oryzae]KAA2213932.1 Trk system potassium transporter TrkA [Pseudoroseomonas oryzae]